MKHGGGTTINAVFTINSNDPHRGMRVDMFSDMCSVIVSLSCTALGTRWAPLDQIGANTCNNYGYWYF